MNTDLKVVARFEIKKFILTVRVSGKGSVRVSGQGICTKLCRYEVVPGTPVKLTAVPAKKWHFKRWKGASTAKKATITITVKASKVVTAVFAVSGPPLSGPAQVS
jgi:hypothetical protein